VKPKPST